MFHVVAGWCWRCGCAIAVHAFELSRFLKSCLKIILCIVLPQQSTWAGSFSGGSCTLDLYRARERTGLWFVCSFPPIAANNVFFNHQSQDKTEIIPGVGGGTFFVCCTVVLKGNVFQGIFDQHYYLTKIFFSVINCWIRALILIVWTWLMNLCNVRLIRSNYGRQNKEDKAVIAVKWLNILRTTEKFFCPKDGVSKQVQAWTAVLRIVHLGTNAENKKLKKQQIGFQKYGATLKCFKTAPWKGLQ